LIGAPRKDWAPVA